jgi:hypothetical protein
MEGWFGAIIGGIASTIGGLWTAWYAERRDARRKHRSPRKKK